MQASGARGSIGKASYEAVRKHIDAGKKATEAFKLVAQETGRSTATVQTAYYRVARSLPGGGGVQLRPRKKTAAKACGSQDCHATTAARPPRGAAVRPRAPQQRLPPRPPAIARQLSDAAEALVVAHRRGSRRNSSTRARTAIGSPPSSAHSADASARRQRSTGWASAHEDLDRPLGTRPPGRLPAARRSGCAPQATRSRSRPATSPRRSSSQSSRVSERCRSGRTAGALPGGKLRSLAGRSTALWRWARSRPSFDLAAAHGSNDLPIVATRAARARSRPLRLRVGDVSAHDRLPPRAARDRARRDPARAAAPLRRRAAQAAPLSRAQGGVLPPRLRARSRHPGEASARIRARIVVVLRTPSDRGALPPRRQPDLRRAARPPRATIRASMPWCCRDCASRPTSCGGSRCPP